MQLNLKDVGEVIASRDLILDGVDKVTILIGKPQRAADGEYWYCPHQKIGMGSGRVKRAEGVDSVQALVLALTMIGAELYTSDEYRDGRLSWLSEKNRDLGFPVTPNIADVLPSGLRSQWRGA